MGGEKSAESDFCRPLINPSMAVPEGENSPTIARMRRNLARLASGSIIAQVLVTVSMPVLTRLFAPEAFGVTALFTAAYGLLIPIITLKYDQAVIMPKSQDRAIAIGGMVMVVATVNSLIVCAVVVTYLVFLSGKREYLWLLLPLALWLGAAFTLMQQWSSASPTTRTTPAAR